MPAKKIEAKIRANIKKKKNHSTELGASSKSNISLISRSLPTQPRLLLRVILTWEEFEHVRSSSVPLSVGNIRDRLLAFLHGMRGPAALPRWRSSIQLWATVIGSSSEHGCMAVMKWWCSRDDGIYLHVLHNLRAPSSFLQRLVLSQTSHSLTQIAHC